MSLFQPVGQIRHTNVAIVRIKKGGKKFEIACYKNKVVEWRNGVEKNLDEVMQIPKVFINVSKGEVAKKEELQKVFNTEDQKKIVETILTQGELQISAKEREQMFESMFKDIVTIVANKCINPDTQRPYPPNIIESALKEIHFAVQPSRNTKQQALEAIKKLRKKIAIERAQMRIQITIASEASKKLKTMLQSNKDNVIESDQYDNGQVTLKVLLDPGMFREVDDHVTGKQGSLEVLDACVVKEGEADIESETVNMDNYKQDDDEAENSEDDDDSSKHKKKKKHVEADNSGKKQKKSVDAPAAKKNKSNANSDDEEVAANIKPKKGSKKKQVSDDDEEPVEDVKPKKKGSKKKQVSEDEEAVEEDDVKPKKKKKQVSSEDEVEQVKKKNNKKKKQVSDDDEEPVEDAKPKKKGSKKKQVSEDEEAVEEDDVKPKKKKKQAASEQEDEQPVKKKSNKKKQVSDEEEQQQPKPKKKKKSAISDDDEPAPTKKKSSKKQQQDEEDDVDEEPAKKKKPSKQQEQSEEEDNEETEEQQAEESQEQSEEEQVAQPLSDDEENTSKKKPKMLDTHMDPRAAKKMGNKWHEREVRSKKRDGRDKKMSKAAAFDE